MMKKIEGTVERSAADLQGHGDHGFHILLKGSSKIFWLPPARKAYAEVLGQGLAASAALVALTSAGDQVSFEAEGVRAKEASFRNWTLEHRLGGSPERDITLAPDAIDLGSAKALLS